MGQAILYCFRCSTQLREAQFEQRKAFRVDAWVCCAACVPEALKSLPPDRAQALQRQISGQTEKRPVLKRDSNTRTPAAPDPAPQTMGGATKLILIAVAAIVAVLLVVMAFSGKPEPETLVRPPDRTAPPPRVQQPPTTVEKSPTPMPVPPPPPTTDSPQKQALLMARQYARENPDDLEGQLRLFGDLSLLEDKTEVGIEARNTVGVLQVKQRHAVEQGLAALGPELADPLVREDYGKALRVLDAALTRIPGAQWKLALEKREREIREKIFASFEIVKAKALDARAKGNRSEIDAVRALVRSWGLEKLSADLDQALAAAGDAAPPAPPASADAKTYATLKEQAFVRASRDFAAAAADLERAGAGLKEDAVRKEIADDVRNLKELDRVYQATIAGLASSKSLTLRTLENQSVSGRVLSADADRVELFVEPKNPTVFVEWSDVRASTLSPFLKSQNAEAPLLALFEQADAVARPKPSAEELRARELYYEAERQFREMATREKAIDAYKQLKLKFKDTALVRRAMARIDRRSESGKEYYFLPADLAFSGTFSPTKDGRVETLTGSEPAQMARNWVEWEFCPLPSATYRCWVLAGGCCAESFSVHLQATGLTEIHPKTKKRAPAEPGSDLWAPVKHSIRNLKPTHPKGEPVKPTRWEWIEIPLPKPATPGVRRARLLTDQQGFGVAAVVVSSTRSRAPTEAESAELAKTRALDAPPAWALQKGGNAARVLLDDFEQAITGWGFHPGSEFPGAKGEQSHDAAVGRDGKGALKIAADFTGGGSYVSSAKTIPAGSDFKEVRLWLKSDNLVHIGVRVGDGTDQCHQMPIMVKPTKEWQEVVLTFEKLAGRESWGGANDRKWHGPAKWFAVCVSKTTFSGKPAGEVWIDDVEGVLNVPE